MSLSAFLNPVKYENKKVVISKRFVDENGNAEEWELQPLNENEVEKIRKAAGANVKQADNASKEQYMSELCAKCVVYPDLKNAQLQDVYGVMGEAELLKEMLLSGEYTRLVLEVTKINGFDTDLGKMVEEAKNS